jgi:sulfoxide reductase heme-binding subunit YedZ
MTQSPDGAMNQSSNKKKIIAAKTLVWMLCLTPLALLLYKGVTGNLGANPIEVITHATGDWVIRLLLVTLAITPLRRFAGWHSLVKFRRLIGLFAFFYAVLHFLTYIWLDKFFDVSEMLKDIAKRRYITVGFTAFVLLIPLAVTSTQGWIRRLGKRWQTVHRLIYASALLGIIHYWWLVKADITLPATYAVIYVVAREGRHHAAGDLCRDLCGADVAAHRALGAQSRAGRPVARARTAAGELTITSPSRLSSSAQAWLAW